jgi:DNA-binding MarR family transcriptional regulator
VLAPKQASDLLAEISELYTIVLLLARRASEREEVAMTATQRHVLIEVTATGPVRPGEVARRLETTRATVTRAVDALENWGFLERKPDPRDRRGQLLAATKKGQAWADRRAAQVLRVLDQLQPSAAPDHLVSDLAALNRALRVATRTPPNGHNALPAG